MSTVPLIPVSFQSEQLYICTHTYIYFILNYRIKLIRKECSKRWPGNNKVYFRSNNANSLILSEMVSSLEPVCTLKEIGFGQSKSERHNLILFVSRR